MNKIVRPAFSGTFFDFSGTTSNGKRGIAVYNSASQSAAASGGTIVPVGLNTLLYNDDGFTFDNVNSTVTVPRDGLYEIRFRTRGDGTSGGTFAGGLPFLLYLLTNGVHGSLAESYTEWPSPNSNQEFTLETVFHAPLSANDVLSLVFVNTDTGAGITIGSSATTFHRTLFAVRWLAV